MQIPQLAKVHAFELIIVAIALTITDIDENSNLARSVATLNWATSVAYIL